MTLKSHVDNFNVVAQGIENKGGVVARHVLGANTRLSVIRSTILNGMLIPRLDMLAVLAVEGDMDGGHALLQGAVVLFEAVLGRAAAEPELRALALDAKAAVLLGALAFADELVPEGLEDGDVEVAHLLVVLADGETEVGDGHFD